MKTVQAALVAGTRQLRDGGIDDPARDGRRLMAHCLRIDAGRLTLHLQDDIGAGALADFQRAIARRAAGRPVSHILGYRDFFGRRFNVSDQVLDPRPETETLVAEALKAPFDHVLDLGTGSGAIIVSLLAECPAATGRACDLSQGALEVAAGNAKALGVASRVEFVQSNWFESVSGTFDLIVSNPPYIGVDEMPALARELSYEPRMALTDGSDGLDAYRAILADVGRHLTTGGRLLVEIGWQQGPQVAALFDGAGLKNIAVLADMDGRNRVVCGQQPD